MGQFKTWGEMTEEELALYIAKMNAEAELAHNEELARLEKLQNEGKIGTDGYPITRDRVTEFRDKAVADFNKGRGETDGKSWYTKDSDWFGLRGKNTLSAEENADINSQIAALDGGSNMTFGDTGGKLYGQDPMVLPTKPIGTQYSGGPLQANLSRLQQEPKLKALMADQNRMQQGQLNMLPNQVTDVGIPGYKPVQHTPNTGKFFDSMLSTAGLTREDFNKLPNKKKSELRGVMSDYMLKYHGLPSGGGDRQGGSVPVMPQQPQQDPLGKLNKLMYGNTPDAKRPNIGPLNAHGKFQQSDEAEDKGFTIAGALSNLDERARRGFDIVTKKDGDYLRFNENWWDPRTWFDGKGHSLTELWSPSNLRKGFENWLENPEGELPAILPDWAFDSKEEELAVAKAMVDNPYSTAASFLILRNPAGWTLDKVTRFLFKGYGKRIALGAFAWAAAEEQGYDMSNFVKENVSSGKDKLGELLSKGKKVVDGYSSTEKTKDLVNKDGSLNVPIAKSQAYTTEDLKKLMGQAGATNTNQAGATNTNNTTPSWVAKAVNAKSPQKGGGMFGAIPGGSGGWDNPMFRIGELIREMDAPGSWKLDGTAARRWSKSAQAHAAAQAVAGKNALAAKNSAAKEQRQVWMKMVSSTPFDETKQKYMKNQGLLARLFPFGDSELTLEQRAIRAATDEKTLKYEMILRDIEPTDENMEYYINLKKAGKLK